MAGHPVSLDPLTPVLVGVGLVDQREDDARKAVEPIALMTRATRDAVADAGVADLATSIDRIYVPVGRWGYGDPGAMVGTAVGSPQARTVSALPGVSQQTILSDAASSIASGDLTVALVVGGEAGYRLLRARIDGVDLSDTENTGTAHVVLTPDDGLLPDYEMASGLGLMPVGYYALMETSYRHARGVEVDRHRNAMADRYHRFSQIAAENPHGWDDRVVAATTIRDARTMAFPYTKHHVSNWNVDQASALLLTSVAEAERRGIDRSKWVFPHAFSEANHIINVSARGSLHHCLGAELAGRAVFDAAACTPSDLDLAEFYTCFPIAVDAYADAIEMPDHIDWSFTGAMPFGGGPFNNFVLHSTAQLAHHLRNMTNGRGLVTTVSGLLTKQGFAVWGSQPNPNGYQFVDVTAETAAAADERVVDPTYQGPATVEGYTVVHTKSGAECGVAVVDLADGRRSIASTRNPQLMAQMEAEEFCGRSVGVANGSLELPPS